MKALAFELNKLRRVIRVQGFSYTFKRDVLNDMNEPTGEETNVAVLRGVFHETTQHIAVTGSDAASIQSKQVPAIMALYDDAKAIQQGDHVDIGDRVYTVTGVLDVNKWGIAADISLEEPV